MMADQKQYDVAYMKNWKKVCTTVNKVIDHGKFYVKEHSIYHIDLYTLSASEMHVEFIAYYIDILIELSTYHSWSGTTRNSSIDINSRSNWKLLCKPVETLIKSFLNYPSVYTEEDDIN